VGPYEILESIGSGGMGEVYRARDTKLDRDVAVKVLPDDVADNEDRLIRFEREAKAVAALSHPNILEIYDFGTDGGTAFAVTELLDGESLRQRLDQGPLPARKTAEIGSKIALGLAAAHDAGVIHRDLKPGNIFLTRDGRVKILDFGLASLQLPGSSSNQSESPTVTRHTDPGTVLGTVGYMSPEQVRGEPADHRSDIFSLGSVLYEMTTGARAFARGTAAETMTAILREDLPETEESGSAMPPNLDRIIRHCLEKQPDERFQSARDLAFHLSSSSGASTTTTGIPPDPAPKPRRRLSLVALGIAGLIGLAGGVIGAKILTAPESTEMQIQKLTTRRGRVWNARFSNDGQSVVYGASWEGQPVEAFTTSIVNPLEWRSLDLGPADILSVAPGGELAVSLGRKFVTGWETTGTLAVVPQGGGAPRPLLDNVLDAEWDPGGEALAVVREVDGRYRLEYPIGTELFVTDGWIEAIRFNPDGDRIAFIDHPLRGDNVGDIAVLDLGSGDTTTVGRGGHNLVWSVDGTEVWSSFGRTVTASDLKGNQRVVYRAPGVLWIQDIAPSGRVLLANQTHRREMVGRPPEGGDEINLSWFDWSTPQALSADGRVVLFDEGNTRGEFGYWNYIRSTDGSAPVRLGSGMAMSLSPDGRWVLTLANPFSDPSFALLPTGPGERRPLPRGKAQPHGLAEFLPSGDRFIFAGTELDQGTRLYVRSLDGTDERPITPAGIDFRHNAYAVSPGGDLVAAPDQDGQMVLYSLEGGEPTPLPGVEAGEDPVCFGPDGTELFVFTPREIPARVFRINVETGHRTPWFELGPADSAGVSAIDWMWITPDGSAYVYSYKRLLSTLYLVDGLR